jgi:hypothetical protein
VSAGTFDRFHDPCAHAQGYVRGRPIFSGGTPVRVAIKAQTFGTYMRVSAGNASAIAV